VNYCPSESVLSGSSFVWCLFFLSLTSAPPVFLSLRRPLSHETASMPPPSCDLLARPPSASLQPPAGLREPSAFRLVSSGFWWLMRLQFTRLESAEIQWPENILETVFHICSYSAFYDGPPALNLSLNCHQPQHLNRKGLKVPNIISIEGRLCICPLPHSHYY